MVGGGDDDNESWVGGGSKVHAGVGILDCVC